MSNKIAQLHVGSQQIDFPVLPGTLGPEVIDIKSLINHGYYTYDAGFYSTAACESKITYIDGDQGILLYRGYPINQLADHSDYMAVCYLLMNGELPNPQQKTDFINQIKQHSAVPDQLHHFFKGFKRDAHPMAMLVGVVGALSGFYHEALDISKVQDRQSAAFHLIGKLPTIAAMSYKFSQGEDFIAPNPELNYTENLLTMMFAPAGKPWACNPIFSRALDRIFTLHADHEQNASTSTVRMAGSTGANPFACIAAGISALWGAAHGGANEACLNMLQEIGSESRINEYIKRAKDKNDSFRLMGFGHRVYKNYDPRAKVMRETCHEVLAATGRQDEAIFKLAMKLEKIALEDPYFIEKKLYPNVDFYSGITLSALGIPTNLFTVMFAVARTVGWISHWLEMTSDPNYRLARPRQLYTGPTERDVMHSGK